MKKLLVVLVIVGSIGLITGCSQEESVTVYTSVDRNYSEQVFAAFEEATGIKVKAVYDTEASKTTGMVNRLIEEKDNPVADVFWNGEFSQTILLKEKDVLQPYLSPSSESIPDKYKDSEGYWTAFGGRARCILVNTETMVEEDYPATFADFLDEKYNPERIGFAYPIFGTTATHGAALFDALGHDEAVGFYQELYDRGIRVLDGNGVVRDLVADGTLDFGMTDTDDAIGAIKDGKPVKIIFPDQEGLGTMLIPNSAAMIKDCSSEEAAKAFLDFLFSEETEKYMIEIEWTQVATRDVGADMPYFDLASMKTMDVSLIDVYATIEATKTELQNIFIR